MEAALTASRSRGMVFDNAVSAGSSQLSLSTAITATRRQPPTGPLTPASASSPTTPIPSGSTPTPQIAIRPTTAGVRSSAPTAAMASLNSPSASGPLTMTTKNWVVPPRPKPGRKPATDTPPTKRKAQNRAAQRAFRERRAARVGELEEQLEEQKEDHDRIIREMQDRITHLEAEAQNLQSRCQWLEALLEKERMGRADPSRTDSMMSTQMQLQTQPGQMDTSQPGQHIPIAPKPPLSTAESYTMSEPRPMAQPFSISHIISPPESADVPLSFMCGNCQTTGPCACADEVLQNTDIPIGCGGCTLGSRCACLEESIKASIAADLKRPRSPGSASLAAPDEKRTRSDDGGMVLETDFTAIFASSTGKTQVATPSVTLAPPTQPLASIEPRESCGFCKDGTYCVCADSMATSMAMGAPSVPLSQPITQQTHTPPPSEDDVIPLPMEVTATGAIKLPGPQSHQQNRAQRPRPAAPTTQASRCGPNGPGTCAQCLADPKSGLFCRSLAANFERNNREQQQEQAAGGGCCGNGGPGGCCKAGNSNAGTGNTDASSAPASSSELGLSLSCADAYKTLASHRHFDEAADDIGSWLPKLRAVPIPPENMRGGGGHFHGHGHVSAGRAPIEVEAASIMSVLKDFDVRFGRGE